MPDVLGSLKNINRNQTISNPTNINTNPVIRSAGMFLMPQNQNEQLRINKPTIEEEQPEQDSTNFLGSLLAQGVASLGAGIQGGDIAQVGRSFEAGRQRAEQDRKAKALIDPKSEESKRRRMVFEKALGFSIPEEYSATDLNDPVVLQSIRDKKMQEMAPKGGGVSGVRGGGAGQGKPEKESKEQKDLDEYTSQAEALKRQLEDYRKVLKQIPVLGGAAIKEKAKTLGKGLLLKMKTVEKTGSLDQGSIDVIEGIIGTPDYTRPEVVDSKIDQALLNINRNVEFETMGKNGLNRKYKPFIPFKANEQENQIINNYFNNPNDPNYSKLYNDLITKKGF